MPYFYRCNVVAFSKTCLYCRVMFKKVTTRKQRKSLIRIAVCLLLVLYYVGSTQFEILHSFVHKLESQVTHTFGQENDPCHRLIYHNDVENECHHDSHLFVSDKCHMCDLVYQGDQTLLTHREFVSGSFTTDHFNFYKDNLDSYWAVISSSRAPPALV